MPSGKRARQQRRQAQTPPPVRSKGDAGGLGSGFGARQASPRTLAIGGGVIVVVIVAVVLAIVLSSGSSTPSSYVPNKGSSGWVDALSGAKYVKNLFKGIPENGLTLGSPNAPATLTEYVDLQCPVCMEYETTQFPTIVQKYVRTGKLDIKLQPWDILSAPDSPRGQAATIAASLQNKAFQYAELLYLNQGTEDTGWLTQDFVQVDAASIDGIKVPKLVSDQNGSTVKSLVSSIDGTANAAGFDSTPTLLLNSRGKTPHVVATTLPNFPQLVAEIKAAIGK